MRKFSLIIAFVPTGVLASFDMMLVPIQFTSRITRFDPVNQISLGSFSTGVPNITAVSANSSAPYALVSGSTTASVNYSTGERLITSSSGNLITLSPDGQTYCEVASNTLRRGNALTLGTAGSTTTGLTTISSICYSSATTLIVLGKDAAGNVLMGSYDPNTLAVKTAFVQIISAASLLAASNPGQMAVQRIGNAPRVGFVYRLASDSAYHFGAISLNLDGTHNTTATLSTSTATLDFSTTNVNTTASTVAGHENFFAVGADGSGTGSRIIEMTGTAGTIIGDNYVTTAFTAPTSARWAMANVVAPEPGTFAAMGLGFLALLKRRSKR